MFDRLMALLQDDKAAPGHDAEERQVAVAALMIEAALMDDHFDEQEHRLIAQLLERRFALDAPQCEALLEIAEKRVEDSPQIYGFTRVIKDEFDHDERIELIEMLWRVVYADGQVGDYEANLMRRTAGLLFVSDRESGSARKRALAQTGQEA